jgi:hypothetical protein
MVGHAIYGKGNVAVVFQDSSDKGMQLIFPVWIKAVRFVFGRKDEVDEYSGIGVCHVFIDLG